MTRSDNSISRAPDFGRSLALATVVTIGWLAVRLWFAFHQPPPIPFIHDEFGYLLEADTFAHGRLTNPPHPLGQFFESPHILIQPTYTAKYPPGSSLFLAAGQVLFGSPYWGVILEGAAMMFAFTLMLAAWAPASWTVAIAAIVGLYQQPTMHWTYSYWGGSVAATGAALVLLLLAATSGPAGPLTGWRWVPVGRCCFGRGLTRAACFRSPRSAFGCGAGAPSGRFCPHSPSPLRCLPPPLSGPASTTKRSPEIRSSSRICSTRSAT